MYISNAKKCRRETSQYYHINGSIWCSNACSGCLLSSLFWLRTKYFSSFIFLLSNCHGSRITDHGWCQCLCRDRLKWLCVGDIFLFSLIPSTCIQIEFHFRLSFKRCTFDSLIFVSLFLLKLKLNSSPTEYTLNQFEFWKTKSFHFWKRMNRMHNSTLEMEHIDENNRVFWVVDGIKTQIRVWPRSLVKKNFHESSNYAKPNRLKHSDSVSTIPTQFITQRNTYEFHDCRLKNRKKQINEMSVTHDSSSDPWQRLSCTRAMCNLSWANRSRLPPFDIQLNDNDNHEHELRKNRQINV